MDISQPTPISPEAQRRALSRLFGDECTSIDTIPPLPKLNEQRRVIGTKPVEQRIEYRMISETPADTDGTRDLGDIMKTYYRLVRSETRGLRAEQSGARMLTVLGYEGDVGLEARRALKRMIVNFEYEANAGENECGGRHSVLTNSGRPEIEEVNRWVNERAIPSVTGRITGM